VVGEFVGADRGLGFLINLSRGLLDTPMLFVALFSLVGIAVALYTAVTVLEYVVLRWRRAS
jgi:NitT/TauT family transport system permease protein